MNETKEQVYRQLLCEAEQIIERLDRRYVAGDNTVDPVALHQQIKAWKEAKDNV